MQDHTLSQSDADGSNLIYYVGVGASAGGLEALESFFSQMPAESGMAFIVIQHLSPDYKSMMVELLSKRTAMPVRRAEEGMLVEVNSVYLIPPKKNLSIFHGKLLLSESDHSRGLNLPIDVFLRSLADDQAEKAIGVILSGTGSDGVRGIRAIKEAGGMVMVQSEESAKFDGMPRAAISTGLTDFILPPDEMPAKLTSFVRHPYAAKVDRPQTLLSDEDRLTRIFALLRERTRVDFTFYKPSTVIRRIERRMTVNQIHDLRDYVKFMESYSGEVTTLYRELLIGVTSFFRDHEVFEELEENHLPALFERVAGREVRFWIAGCSTGEEAYSLAMSSREVMERIGRQVDIKIFATDIDRDAILRASNGLYPESIAADLSSKLLTKYFHRREEHYQIDRSIREMVVFAQHNLIKDPPFTNIELVSCRNLLIYLQPVLQRKALELMSFSLNPQGILLLGSSETTGEVSDLYETLHQKYKIYASRGKRRPAGGPEFLSVPEVRSWQNRPRFPNGPWPRGQDEERM
ncbi:MAG: chemotaxis protein CheR, partial [Candidatus Competibacteraceae bacterium]|nr:chemotaxis protein CheR [Candidatus Competibacteraceae bacterium]